MGLVATVETANNEEIAYWYKCWWLHKYMGRYYSETNKDFSDEFDCIDVELNLHILSKIHLAMCTELYKQSISIDTVEDYPLNTSDVDEIKKVILFKQDNPEVPIFYNGGY